MLNKSKVIYPFSKILLSQNNMRNILLLWFLQSFIQLRLKIEIISISFLFLYSKCIAAFPRDKGEKIEIKERITPLKHDIV